jgi:hypothetical protein
MKNVVVKHLQAGDVLSSGTLILSAPEPEFHPMYKKGSVRIKVRYSNGKEKVQVWNKETVVSVKIDSTTELLKASIKLQKK